MLTYNTMRFLTDTFKPYNKQALLISKIPLDLSDFDTVGQIDVLGNEPEGSQRRFMFKMGDKVYKFNGQDLVEYTGTVNSDNVLANGNTAAQVEAVRDNTQIAGKKIYPIIALYSESATPPTAKLTATGSSGGEVLDFTKEHTPAYFHDEYVDPSGGRVDGTILGFGWDIETNGDAEGGFKVQLLQDGEWSSYLTLTEAKGQTAKGFRAKWYYHVDAINDTNSVKIKKFHVYWSPDVNSRVYGDVAYLTSVVKNFGLALDACVLVVRHEALGGGSLAAQCCFQKKRLSVSGEQLGYQSSGVYQTAHRFIPNSLKVYVNGNTAGEFDFQDDNQHFSVAESRWATAPYSVSCSYQYDADDETWLDMVADTPQQADNGVYTSRFFLKNPNSSAKQLGAIRLILTRGRDTNSTTREGTGSEQRVKFSRRPDEIECDATESWYYDDETNEIVFVSAEGSTVHISYTWHGKTPAILGWSAAFSAKSVS